MDDVVKNQLYLISQQKSIDHMVVPKEVWNLMYKNHVSYLITFASVSWTRNKDKDSFNTDIGVGNCASNIYCIVFDKNNILYYFADRKVSADPRDGIYTNKQIEMALEGFLQSQ